MKKEYSKPNIDITEFECEDITTSTPVRSIKLGENECEIICY